jgi:hypothetical protein
LIVPNAYKLLITIRACEDKSSDAQHVLRWYFCRIRSETLELERVYADWDWTNETVVQFLI